METHNKILLAGELLVDSAETYRSGNTNVDFAKSILTAGAVIGIVTPWPEELGIKSSHIQSAEIAAKLNGINLTTLPEKEKRTEIGKSITFYRLAYNSLKHTGNGKTLKASNDLTFKANLKEEAYHLIGSAIEDYSKIILSQQINNTQLSEQLLTLIQSAWIA